MIIYWHSLICSRSAVPSLYVYVGCARYMFTLGGASLYVYVGCASLYGCVGCASPYGYAGRCLATWLRWAVPRYMVALGGASLYGCARRCFAIWLRSAVPRYMVTLGGASLHVHVGCASLYVQIFYSWSKDKVNQNIGDVVDPLIK